LTGTPITGASNAGEVGTNSEYLAMIADCWTCERRVQYTPVDNDEVYDKKPQRYARDNRTAFNCMQ